LEAFLAFGALEKKPLFSAPKKLLEKKAKKTDTSRKFL